jgi:hypothetical protein
MPDHALSSSASTSLLRRGLKASTYARADVNESDSRRRDEDEAEADEEEAAAKDEEEADDEEEDEEEDEEDEEDEEELLPDDADQVSAPGAQLSTVRWKGCRMSSRLCLNILSVALPPVRSFGEEGSEEACAALGPPGGLVFRGYRSPVLRCRASSSSSSGSRFNALFVSRRGGALCHTHTSATQ